MSIEPHYINCIYLHLILIQTCSNQSRKGFEVGIIMRSWFYVKILSVVSSCFPMLTWPFTMYRNVWVFNRIVSLPVQCSRHRFNRQQISGTNRISRTDSWRHCYCMILFMEYFFIAQKAKFFSTLSFIIRKNKMRFWVSVC